MTLLETRTHTHNNTDFELKLFETDTGFSVVAFLNGKQVSPSYTVTFETNQDHFMEHKDDLIDSLFGHAQSDLKNGLYFKG